MSMTKENIADRLIKRIIELKAPIVVGLDPVMGRMPACYKEENSTAKAEPLKAAADVIFCFNQDVIDAVAPFVPAVKPQMAFYEMYGSHGVAAFEKTVAYAKEKGLIVIEDAKRNDIGNTAKAYANGHLGEVELVDGSVAPSLDVDYLTVTPYLGYESLTPFVEECKLGEKGIFILVKTSNRGSGEIQDVVAANGKTISQNIACYINEQAEKSVGNLGYSSIGAVVGATYPGEAKILRALMSKSIFLVPGYGAQGAGAEDIVPCFNQDGLGAVINASRSVLYGYEDIYRNKNCTKDEYKQSAADAVIKMREEILCMLRKACPNMMY